MFKNLRTKATASLMKKQMAKQGVSGPQQQMLLKLVEENPELFKKMSEEIKVKTKAGKGEMAASMEVMKKYQSQLQKLAQKK